MAEDFRGSAGRKVAFRPSPPLKGGQGQPGQEGLSVNKMAQFCLSEPIAQAAKTTMSI